MAISDKIERLEAAKTDIASALVERGVQATGHGYSQFANDIDEISTQAVLHDISIAFNTYDDLIIDNPEENGNFVTGYEIYIDGIIYKTITATSISMEELSLGQHNVKVRPIAENFQVKDSNELSYFLPEYLCFTATGDEDAVVSLTKVGSFTGPTIQYKLYGGQWSNLTFGTSYTIPIGQTCKFRGLGTNFSQGTGKYLQFVIYSGYINASGSVQSLCIGNYNKAPRFCSLFANCTRLMSAPKLTAIGFSNTQSYYDMFYGCTSLTIAPELPALDLTNYTDCYYRMFYGCSSLVSVPTLPATILSERCYYYMFANCTSLVSAPSLPSNILSDSCYAGMFYGCSSLINPPVLPAMQLTNWCYFRMFQNCTLLANTPQLPATNLSTKCYLEMFSGCSNLVNVSTLPSTTLASSCYRDMFDNCKKLTNAPELPATTLQPYCYTGMFSGCTSLVVSPRLPATTLAQYCYNYMFSGCSQLVTPPDLQAEQLVSNCYSGMFSGCTSLTTAPELPSLNLAPECYASMFFECSSLSEAPILSATTLYGSCYACMFGRCTSLTSTPLLPATTLANSCYRQMFLQCTSLITALELPALVLVDKCYEEMFYLCDHLTRSPHICATSLSGSQNASCREMFNGCSRLKYIDIDYTGQFDGSSLGWSYKWLSGVAQVGSSNYSGTLTTRSASTIPAKWIVGDISNILHIKALENTTIKFTKVGSFTSPTMGYSINGETWDTYTIGNEIQLSINQNCYFVNYSSTFSYSVFAYIQFSSTGQFECYGSLDSLTNYGGDLGDGLYYSLFSGCTKLLRAPDSGYNNGTKAQYCTNMFYNCTSLVTPPLLPATNCSSNYCYSGMFAGCTSLDSVPVLPATTLGQQCYSYMFQGCTSLLSAPQLPSTVLVYGCYDSMFEGCTSLNTIELSYTGDFSETYFENWVNGVAETGDFYYDGTDTTRGVSAIPEKWRVNGEEPPTPGNYTLTIDSKEDAEEEITVDGIISSGSNSFTIDRFGTTSSSLPHSISNITQFNFTPFEYDFAYARIVSGSGYYYDVDEERVDFVQGDLISSETMDGIIYLTSDTHIAIQYRNEEGEGYTVTTNFTNVSGSLPSVVTADLDEWYTITPSSGYILPNSITVTGCSYEWNPWDSSEQLWLFEPESNITITITGQTEQMYTITGNLTNVTCDELPTTMSSGVYKEFTVIPDEGYLLPEDITISGQCLDKDWAPEDGYFYITRPSSNMTVTIVGVAGTEYNITGNLTNVTCDDLPTTMIQSDDQYFTVTPDSGYVLPEDITVQGTCEWSWDPENEELNIWEVQSDIIVTITGEPE